MRINDTAYENNLVFYSMLKFLVQSKCDDNKILRLKRALVANKDAIISDRSNLVPLILESGSVAARDTGAYNGLLTFFSYKGTDSNEMWFDFAIMCTEVFSIKSLLIAESKHYANVRAAERIVNDRLSLAYDFAGLHAPYGTRVAGTMIIYGFDPYHRNSSFILDSTEREIDEIIQQIAELEKKYDVNISSMYSILIGESLNQSITSDAGTSYEDRASSAINTIVGVSNIRGHSHDSAYPAVEYDFTFEFEGKTFGTSVKRTVRERYKQNLQHNDNLADVDYMILITLGTDMNEAKMNNITSYRGYYIVVADEVYNSKPYRMRNTQIIPSSRFTAETLHRIIGA